MGLASARVPQQDEVLLSLNKTTLRQPGQVKIPRQFQTAAVEILQCFGAQETGFDLITLDTISDARVPKLLQKLQDEFGSIGQADLFVGFHNAGAAKPKI